MAKIGELIVKIGADASTFKKELHDSTTQMQGFGNKISSIGKKAANVGAIIAKSLAVGAVAAGAALGAIAIKAGQTADELLTLSNQTGLATDTLQGFDYAARFIDVELEAMQKGLAKVVKAMGEATKQGEDYIDVSGLFRVNMKDANGELKTSEEMFYNIIDAIGALGSETEKEIAAQELFSRSYQDIMPLIKAGTGELKKYIQEAEKLGLVISNKDLVALGEFDDAMQRINAQAKAVGMKIAVALLPVMKDMANFITNEAVPAVEEFLKKYQDNPEFEKLSFSAKIEFILQDIGGILNNWWTTGGEAKVQAIGEKVAKGVGAGFKAVAPTVGALMADALVIAFTASLKSSPLGAMLAGAVTGGTIGSVVPGMGTAVGAVVGGASGGVTWGVNKVIDKLTGADGKQTSTNREPIFSLKTINSFGAFKQLPGNALGTNFWKGGLTWVGERGPELLNLPRGAQIISNDKSMAAISGQRIVHSGTVIHQFQTADGTIVKRIAEEFERGNRRIPQRVATLPSMS